MALFRPELGTCPICGSTGNCHIHDYYGGSIIDFQSGRQEKSNLCVLRVFCDSCSHAHAILPDIIIPYSNYSLLFILRILGEYFAELYTIEQLCERYGISQNQLFKWIALFRSHKQEWLGILSDLETSDVSFLRSILLLDSFSSFAMGFVLRFAYSFLQSHRNPVPVSLKNAQYHQKVFAPDISIF